MSPLLYPHLISFTTISLSLEQPPHFMEKQRSFSIKPTRFLAFSCSIIVFTFFSIWVYRNSLLVDEQNHFLLPKASLDLNSFQSKRTVFTPNTSFLAVKVPILNQTHFSQLYSGPEFGRNTSNDSKISEFGKNLAIDLKNLGSEKYSGGAINGSSLEKAEVSKIGRTSHGNDEMGSGEVICDVTKGEWVFDESYPLYTAASCPFIDEGFNCEGNGRLDKDYMRWRWKPHGCDFPRFNATNMLELIRGKRLVFVGDSINRNQWESMLCLLMSVIKDTKKVYETHGRRITKGQGNYRFNFVDYQCTVEYYVTHYLVHESKAKVRKKRVQTLRIDTLDRGSSRWRGADILIFNTAHWWSHDKTQSGINYYQEKDQVHHHLDVSTAFEKALLTWSTWVDKQINAEKTKVFFRSSAPSHFRGGEWHSGGHCKEASKPLNITYRTRYPEMNLIVERALKQMITPVTFLNITSLSDYRVDGHPSIYKKKDGKTVPLEVEDCSHWCLPGVPDTWNQLLYFHLHSKIRDNFLL